MKTFGTNYLEPLVTEVDIPIKEWTWTPSNPEVKEIYASGKKTATKQSTYATEKDSESDSDRPDEGK